MCSWWGSPEFHCEGCGALRGTRDILPERKIPFLTCSKALTFLALPVSLRNPRAPPCRVPCSRNAGMVAVLGCGSDQDRCSTSGAGQTAPFWSLGHFRPPLPKKITINLSVGSFVPYPVLRFRCVRLRQNWIGSGRTSISN